MCVAWLHDVVEDSDVTLDELRDDFSDAIVDALTRRDARGDDYYRRVASNDLAVAVKRADIWDDTNPERLAALPASTRDGVSAAGRGSRDFGAMSECRRTLGAMSMTLAEVEQALLALDRQDRAEVLHRGIRSLEMDDAVDEEQAEVDAAWRAELRRRIDEIESGKVELLDADESHAQLRAEHAARRK